MNLLEKGSCNTPNYYCTWAAQNHARNDADTEQDVSAFEGDQGAKMARNYLNEKSVFSDEGMIHQYDKVRGDLYFVFDDGWDVPYGVHPDTQVHLFGSCELNEERFPSCSGIPAERLKKLNQWVKSFGWRGAGLWVASQAVGDGVNGGRLDFGYVEKYWRERAKWCKEAGIEYWKVDWGARNKDLEFREMLTRIAREEAPGLVLEHCRTCGPYNGSEIPWEDLPESGDGRYSTWGNFLNEALEILSFSDVLRSYDTTSYLSAASTLDRVASFLVQARIKEGAAGIINCEDEIYIAAGLGCSFGTMRSGLCRSVPGMENDPRHSSRSLDEVTRCARWQRMSPAFGANANTTHVSGEILTDSWVFRKGDTWASWAIGKEIKQACPAVISRGIDLPKVISEGEPPFILASRNPNGAVSIASIPRTHKEKGIYFPQAGVEINAGSSKNPTGIFGNFDSIALLFSEPIEGKQIWAQDLAADRAEDVTARVTVNENKLLLSGDVIRGVGLSAATPGDLSDPGLIIRVL